MLKSAVYQTTTAQKRVHIRSCQLASASLHNPRNCVVLHENNFVWFAATGVGGTPLELQQTHKPQSRFTRGAESRAPAILGGKPKPQLFPVDGWSHSSGAALSNTLATRLPGGSGDLIYCPQHCQKMLLEVGLFMGSVMGSGVGPARGVSQHLHRKLLAAGVPALPQFPPGGIPGFSGNGNYSAAIGGSLAMPPVPPTSSGNLTDLKATFRLKGPEAVPMTKGMTHDDLVWSDI